MREAPLALLTTSDRKVEEPGFFFFLSENNM